MHLPTWFSFVVVMAVCLSSHAQAQSPDDDLRVYAVNVVKTRPLEKQFTGYGIYLGQGKVITAAHVVGNWPSLTHPRVLIAGLDLPAKIVKKGSLEDTDLALLSVDEAQLPISLRLRRNPLCKTPSPFGAKVIVIYPERSAPTHIISPLLIAPQYRASHSSLVSEVQSSGSGVFDAERRCLLGIISQKVQKYNYRRHNGRWMASVVGYAGSFVPASRIADFIPAELRF